MTKIITMSDWLRGFDDKMLSKIMAPCGCPPDMFARSIKFGKICDKDRSTCESCWQEWLKTPLNGGGGGK